MKPRTSVSHRPVPTTEEVHAKASVKDHLTHVDELLDSEGPLLDENEQAAVIREFEQVQLKQNRAWRTMFGWAAAALATFFAHAAWSQSVDPWGLRYTGEFQSVATSGGVIGVLTLQALGLASAAVALLQNVPRKGDCERGCLPTSKLQSLAVAVGTLLATIGAVFWGSTMHQMVLKHGYNAGMKWELSWLPVAPLVWCVLCQYVLWSLNANAADIQRLRQYAYHFKKV